MGAKCQRVINERFWQDEKVRESEKKWTGVKLSSSMRKRNSMGKSINDLIRSQRSVIVFVKRFGRSQRRMNTSTKLIRFLIHGICSFQKFLKI